MIASANEIFYFIELANRLNFSRASERLGISQPSLSIAIKRLEHAIGTELFIRKKSGIVLTQSGKRLFVHAKSLLQMWDQVKSASLASHFEVEGTITIGAHPSVALFALCDFLPKFSSQYPKLEIQLKHGLSRVVLEGVVNLSIDIGIIVNPIKHPDLIIQKLYDDQVTFWHSHTLKNPLLKLQKGEVALICDPDLMQTQWLLKKAQKSGLTYKRLTTSNSLEVIASLTANGAGVCILPKGVVNRSFPTKLKPLTNMPVYLDEINLVYRHENRYIKSVQTLTKAIKANLKNS